MIVICGSGFAGYTTAEKIRKTQPDVPITIVTDTDGSFFPKPQLSVSFDKQKSMDDLITQSAVAKAERLDLTVHANQEIQLIDTERQQVISDGMSLAYDTCVYAMGSHAIPLRAEVDPQAQDAVHVLNSLMDYNRVLSALSRYDRCRVGVIGCGLIGYELIATLNRYGAQVTAFHDQRWMLNQLLPEEGQQYATDAVQSQCEYYPEFLTERITRSDQGLIVSNGEHEVEVDQVIVAIGVRANTLCAQKSGFITDRMGVVVNEVGQVQGMDNIWAVGDCVSLNGHSFKYIAFGRYMADVIAHNMFTQQRQSLTHKPFPYTVKSTICPVSVMGIPDNGLAWDWEITDTSLVGMQYSDGKLKAWCLCGDDKALKAKLTQSLASPVHTS